MTPDALKTNGPQLAATMAFYSAANSVVIANSEANSLHWPALGSPDSKIDNAFDEYLGPLAAFVRMNIGAPAESLYRFAAGYGMHTGEPHLFDTLAFEFRAAFSVFTKTLPIFDGLIAEEVDKAKAAIAPKGPVLAAALMERIEDTLLAPIHSVFDRVEGAPTVTVVQPAEPVDPAPIPYWINPTHHLADGPVQTMPASPADGWVLVDKASFDAFSADLAASVAAGGAAVGPVQSSEQPPIAATVTQDAAEPEASTAVQDSAAVPDGEQPADPTADTAATLKPPVAARRRVPAGQ